MATNTLTDSQCRSFKPQAKGYKKFDGEDLYLWITPAGSGLTLSLMMPAYTDRMKF